MGMKRRFAATTLIRLWSIIFGHDATLTERDKILATVKGIGDGTVDLKEAYEFFQAVRLKNIKTSLEGFYEDILNVLNEEIRKENDV